MRKKFGELVKDMDSSSKVLDVGGGGLGGRNTTLFLLEKFGEENVTCIDISRHRVKDFCKEHPNVTTIIGDFYEYEFEEKYDLVVLDLPADQNKQSWENGDFPEEAKRLLKKGGFLINYINFEGINRKFQLKDLIEEDCRDGMVWAKFQKL